MALCLGLGVAREILRMDDVNASIECPVCGGQEFSQVAQVRWHGERAVLRCLDCWLEFIFPLIPSQITANSAVTADEYRHALKTWSTVLAARAAFLAKERLKY